MKYPARKRFPWLSVGGLGYMSPASGTWGSLPAVGVAALLIVLGQGPRENPAIFYGILATVAFVFSAVCVFQGSQAEAVHGKDPSIVVADEMAGQCVALLYLPAMAVSTGIRTAGALAVAFFAFRILDIIKPWPARQIQGVPGGWGILLDDLFAGAYALAVVQMYGLVLNR